MESPKVPLHFLIFVHFWSRPEEPISAEAHAKFRRVLGRLSWLAQTRQDILILIAMLSTGQSCPKPGHEKALRAVLRFMLLHMKMSQKFPSPGLEDLSEKDIGLEVYSDAGFAPMQATQGSLIAEQ